uniref:Uncharacterized protein n=1 Tax=Arundo donax TaxID=35708 RepID=A0A0A8XXV6_ARUDO
MATASAPPLAPSFCKPSPLPLRISSGRSTGSQVGGVRWESGSGESAIGSRGGK